MIKYYRNLPPIWQLFLFTGITIVSTFLFSFLLLPLCVPFGIPLNDFSSAIGENFFFSQACNAFSQIGTFFVPAIVFAYLFYDNPKNYFSFKYSGKMTRFLFWSLALMLVSIPLVSVIAEWNQSLHFPENWQNAESYWRGLEEKSDHLFKFLIKNTSISGLIVNLIVVGILPAICEELFFRGVLQQVFVRLFWNAHVGIWLCAIIFSFFHWQIFGFFPRLLLGLFLGYAFYYGRNITISMCMHFLNNGIVVSIYYLIYSGYLNIDPDSVESIGNPVLLGIISLILIIVISYILFKNRVIKKPEKVNQE